jgi:DNA-binding response OmpR family regulator
MAAPARNTSAIPGRHHPDVMETPTMEPPPPSTAADPAGATVLVVDDEPIVREIVATYLRREGYRALEAGDGVTARDLIERAQPALVVLDVMLPGIDGLELCRWIRARSEVPVIMLTARGEEADRIVGLDIGADDYVTKPFSPRELVARVRSVLRRSPGGTGSRRIEAGPLLIDAGTREVTRDGEPLRLTAKEFDLLWFLAGNPRLVFSRDQLMDRVWGYEAAFDTGTVTVHVRRLREKIEHDPSRPRHVQTVWGVGYRFVP